MVEDDTLLSNWFDRGKVLVLISGEKRVSLNIKVEEGPSNTLVKVVEEAIPEDFRWLRSHLDLIEGFGLPNKGERLVSKSLDFVHRTISVGVLQPSGARDKDLSKEVRSNVSGTMDQLLLCKSSANLKKNRTNSRGGVLRLPKINGKKVINGKDKRMKVHFSKFKPQTSPRYHGKLKIGKIQSGDGFQYRSGGDESSSSDEEISRWALAFPGSTRGECFFSKLWMDHGGACNEGVDGGPTTDDGPENLYTGDEGQDGPENRTWTKSGHATFGLSGLGRVLISDSLPPQAQGGVASKNEKECEPAKKHGMMTRRSKKGANEAISKTAKAKKVELLSLGRKESWNLEEEFVKILETGLAEGYNFNFKDKKLADILTAKDASSRKWQLEVKVAKVIETGVALGFNFHCKENVMIEEIYRMEEEVDQHQRGLGKMEKCRMVRRLVRKHNPISFFIQESKLADFDNRLISALRGSFLSRESERQEPWEFILDKKLVLPGWWIIGGDFNTILDPGERRGGECNMTSVMNFGAFLSRAKVIDIPMQGMFVNWSNHKERASCARLDRFLVSPVFCRGSPT
ncbi:hypothetical protein Dsin_021989 [Dipteronia sinensis]|uniref:DUF4283 domain-containing protein n=1 Tax=Dipteronia sinensis TaxID=43782 RepID=A0AAE0A0S0_9ROSI|nr:hypothetical protein Dsin_021989 [Dipteronia sinensis]